MSDIFSDEMKKEIIKLFNKRLDELNLGKELDTLRDVTIESEKRIQSLFDEIEDVRDTANSTENDLDDKVDETRFEQRMQDVEYRLDHLRDYVQQDELEQLVGKTMLELIPNFNERISKEIKKHLVVLAEFVIVNFKEKE